MENETEMLDSQNEQEVDDTSSDTDTQSEVDVEALKQQNRELFARAKRAEGFELKDGKWVKKEKPAKVEEVKTETKEETMGFKDIRALQDVPDEDVEDVIDWARFKKIPIAEAKASDHIKNLLKTKAEQRKTAQTTNTGSYHRVTTKNSEQAINQRIDKGELKDEEMQEAAKLVIAGWATK